MAPLWVEHVAPWGDADDMMHFQTLSSAIVTTSVNTVVTTSDYASFSSSCFFCLLWEPDFFSAFTFMQLKNLCRLQFANIPNSI